MSGQSNLSIVPQLGKSLVRHLHARFFLLVSVLSMLLVACSSVQLQVSKPLFPTTIEEARAYMADRDRKRKFLEYELIEQSRACYKKFFVANCLDDVRQQGVKIRRSHLEVQGRAEDMIRLDDYTNRRSKKLD
jgi:hypothetical protein